MKRILVGLDGSPRGPGVLAVAVAIARAQGAQVTLLRSVGLPPDVPQDFWKTTDEPLLDLLERHAREYLAQQVGHVPAELAGGTEIVVGVPWQAICETARTLDADLVVIGSHGYAGVDRLLGTTAAKVVNHAHCSVLVVRDPHHELPGDPVIPRVLLVATDFSATARAAADWAVSLAGGLGARVVVAHVFDLPLVGLPDASLLVDAKTAARLSDDAQRALDAELARLRGRGVDVEGLLRQGDPRDALAELARSEGAGLIVVGSHGRRGLARALLGSVAESLVRDSTVPVAVLRDGVRPPAA